MGVERMTDGQPSHVVTYAHEPPPSMVCSARGCRARPQWALRWNNPRLHTPERRKTWLACADHREHLADFLSLRGFLCETVPAAELLAAG